MVDRLAPANITSLYPNEVFVFGSNRRGSHGAGAADFAFRNFGAVWGKGEGLANRSYALPTKDRNIQTLPLEEIKIHIENFIDFANGNPQLVFLVTQVGCGLAGYKPEDIAPLFAAAKLLENIYLPIEFWRILNNEASH